MKNCLEKGGSKNALESDFVKYSLNIWGSGVDFGCNFGGGFGGANSQNEASEAGF